MKHVCIGLFALTFALWLPATTLAAYTQAGNSIDVSQSVNDDAYVAGSTVSITAPVHGELFTAGQSVTVTDSVDRNIFAAGNTVTVNHGAAHNAFVAGNTVTLSGTYGHDVFAAGSSVIVESGTVIQGTLYAAGQSVVLHGTVNGDVRASASTFTSDAVIGGSFTGYVQDLTFTGGTVNGDVSYRSDKDAAGLSMVTVKGSTTRSTPTSAETSSFSKSNEGFNAFSAFFRFLGLMLMGALLILLMPKKVQLLADDVRSNWGASLGWGLAGFIGGPLVAMLAFMTFIGWPVGLIVLAVWLIELFLAAIFGTITLGALIMRMKAPNWWTALAVGALAVVIFTSLPAVGGLVRFVVFFALTLPTFGSALQWWKKTLA